MLLLWCIVVLQATSALGSPWHTPTTRIVGGSNATEGQYPGVVSLRHPEQSDSIFCGGAIIEPDLILTAARCLQYTTTEEIEVVAGSIRVLEGGVHVGVRKLITHEDYGVFSFNDIGLLLLDTPLNYSDVIQPLKLAEGDTVSAGDTVTAVGWGSTEFSKTSRIHAPDTLQWLERKVTTNDECGSMLDTQIKEEQMCVAGEEGLGLCFGDTGSPLIHNGDTAVGIVSWITPCARGYPDVFTRVSEYLVWIQDNSKKMREHN